MRYLWLSLCLIGTPALAQQADDDRGFLTGLIEDAVSGLGREVRLEGFEGALSSRATVEAITIADDTGVWLRLEDASLQWNRSALLSGAIKIEELAAERILLNRVPKAAGNELPSAEATPFALPDLPVSVEIGEIRADRIEIAREFLGEPVAARLQGAVSLIEGQADAELALQRIDDKIGQFSLDTFFDDETGRLDLSLIAEEGQNGLAARLLGLPGRPALRLEVDGDAPISEFGAELTLATNGQDQITGHFQLGRENADTTPAATWFNLALGGDLRPLLEDDYHAFFGPSSSLLASGVRHGDGRIDLSSLSIDSEQLTLGGSALVSAEGWPQAFDLTGTLAAQDGRPVRLPVAGPRTELRRAEIEVSYDADDGEGWTGRFAANGFARPDTRIEALTLDGTGTIRPGEGDLRGRFAAELEYQADGIMLEDPDLSRAIGPAITGSLNFARLEGEPFVVQDFRLSGAGLAVRSNAIVSGPERRFRSLVDAQVRATDFSRFAGLTELDLQGNGQVDLDGRLQPFDGIFDISLGVETRDLGLGLAELDPLLAGQTSLALAVARDETGTRLENLTLRGDHIRADARAEITGEGASATVDARITDLGRVLPDLAGPGTLRADLSTDEAGLVTARAALAAPDTLLEATGTATPQGEGYAMTGRATLDARTLSRFEALAGVRMGGALSLELTGDFDSGTGAASATLRSETQDLRAGPQGLDPLLRGSGSLDAGFDRRPSGRITLNGLNAQFPNITAQGDVVIDDSGQAQADLALRLADVGLLAPDFAGPANADVTARQDAGGWQVSGQGTGPAGTRLSADGRVGDAGQLALSLAGQAPLGLANAFIAPRQVSGLASFDLSVNGPPRLSSIGGRVTLSDGRLTAPNLRQAIEAISGNVDLISGQASMDISGDLAAGGQVGVNGTVGLAPPSNADISIELRRARLREPALYETRADGTVQIAGPLAGGARIFGQVDIGRTEIRVPSSPVSTLGDLPAVTHVSPGPAVRRTLDRAGVGPDPDAAGDGAVSTRPYPLDLTINAPSRIFVRGRGLDAELGGSLRLSGTTGDVIPIGRFDLLRGRLDVLGQRFALTEGYAQLQGDFTPYLRLVARTEARSGTDVSIIVEGPADDPQVSFESSPELPQDEVLAQLLFGRDLSSISPLQAVQLASAVATLSGRGGGGALEGFREGLDLDDFDVTTDEDGNAAVRAGKYISENIYTDITIGSDGTSEINLNLDVTDDVTARGSFGSEGESSLGIFYERDY